jgi:hypothetical protein
MAEAPAVPKAEEQAPDVEPSNFAKEPVPAASDLIEESAKPDMPTVVVSSAGTSGQKGWFMCCGGESQTEVVVKA